MAPLQLKVEPLTHEAWATFGHVIQGAENSSSVPQGIAVNMIWHTTRLVSPRRRYVSKSIIDLTNIFAGSGMQGHKFNRLAPITSSYYPASSSTSDADQAVTSISLARIGPVPGLTFGTTFEVRMMERHLASSQAFIPLNTSGDEWTRWNGEKGLKGQEQTAGGMLVIGALNGKDDKPDLSTLRVFISSPSQGLSYNEGVWHHSVLSFNYADYAIVDTQITTDSSLKVDCEILRRKMGEEEPFAIVEVPLIQ